MKKKLISGILLTIVIAALLWLFWPAQSSPFTDRSPDFWVTVQVEDDTGALIYTGRVGVAEQASVFDITRHALREAGVGCSSSGSGATAYIKGIGDLYEFDKSPTSGWIYMVNGDAPALQSSGSYQITAASSVLWRYVLEPVV